MREIGVRKIMWKRYVGDRAFYRRVMAVAVPIMLQNGITNFVSMLDNLMVGRVGTVEMTGVAIANQLMFVYQLCLFGAVSGVGIFGAQFYGRGDNEGLRDCFRFKVMLCTALTVAGGALILLAGEPLCALFLQGEGAVEDAAASLRAASEYLNVMLVGLVPTALVQCYASTLRETGETLLPMKAGVAAVLVNLCFNYILIFGHFGAPRLGVRGAAIATVLSRFVEAAIVMGWTHRHAARNRFIVGAWRSFRVAPSLMGQMLAKGAPLMLNEVLWASGLTVLTQCYSVRGLNVVAAINISQTFWNVFSVTFMTTGTGIGIIIGQLLGAGECERAREEDRKLIAFSVFISVLIGAVYALCAPYIPYLYNTTPDVRELASRLMFIGACFMPVSAFIHASYFTLRSGGKTIVTFFFDSAFVWLVTVPLAFFLSRYTSLAILPLYLSCQAVDLIKCVVGWILVKRGSWVRVLISE